LLLAESVPKNLKKKPQNGGASRPKALVEILGSKKEGPGVERVPRGEGPERYPVPHVGEWQQKKASSWGRKQQLAEMRERAPEKKGKTRSWVPRRVGNWEAET